jgi:hypothetical protein
MVSPSFAIASACRNEPGPLSLVLLTISVVACAGIARMKAKIAQIGPAAILFTLLIPQSSTGIATV